MENKLAMADSPDDGVDIQNLYFNGFQLGLSNADVSALLTASGKPIASITMSYTTAKTLSKALTEMMETLERVTGREIMTISQVSEGLEKLTTQEDEANERVH